MAAASDTTADFIPVPESPDDYHPCTDEEGFDEHLPNTASEPMSSEPRAPQDATPRVWEFSDAMPAPSRYCRGTPALWRRFRQSYLWGAQGRSWYHPLAGNRRGDIAEIWPFFKHRLDHTGNYLTAHLAPPTYRGQGWHRIPWTGPASADEQIGYDNHIPCWHGTHFESLHDILFDGRLEAGSVVVPEGCFTGSPRVEPLVPVCCDMEAIFATSTYAGHCRFVQLGRGHFWAAKIELRVMRRGFVQTAPHIGQAFIPCHGYHSIAALWICMREHKFMRSDSWVGDWILHHEANPGHRKAGEPDDPYDPWPGAARDPDDRGIRQWHVDPPRAALPGVESREPVGPAPLSPAVDAHATARGTARLRSRSPASHWEDPDEPPARRPRYTGQPRPEAQGAMSFATPPPWPDHS